MVKQNILELFNRKNRETFRLSAVPKLPRTGPGGYPQPQRAGCRHEQGGSVAWVRKKKR